VEKKEIRFWVLAATVFSALLVMSTPLVSATGRGDASNLSKQTFTVSEDSWDTFEFTLSGSEVFDLSIKVTSGGNVDFYILTPDGYDDYTSPTATSFAREKWDEKSKSWDETFDEDGDFYLVVDNAEVSTSGASPSGDVTYEIDSEVRDKTLWEKIKTLLMYVAIIAVILLYILFKIFRRR